MANGENGDDEDDDGTGDVPKPRPIEIDNLDDTISPYQSLNGTSLEDRERVALARLEGATIGRQRVPARISLELGETVAHALDALAGELDATLLDDVDLENGIQLLLAGDADDQTSLTADSPAGRAVEKLIALITAPDLDTLRTRLRGYDDDLLRVLEQLMLLMVQGRVDLHLQPAASSPPTRLSSERAGAFLGVMQRARTDDDRPQSFIGRLDGVEAPEGSDRREFRLSLRETWKRRRVIRGTFDPDLTETMVRLLLEPVIIVAEVERHTHGERRSRLRFHATNVRPIGEVHLTLGSTEEQVA